MVWFNLYHNFLPVVETHQPRFRSGHGGPSFYVLLFRQVMQIKGDPVYLCCCYMLTQGIAIKNFLLEFRVEGFYVLLR